LKFHPDRNTTDPNATANFQKIADAYYVLADKERRTKYDSENSFEFEQQVNPIAIFAEMFNDLMVPEVPNPSYWWQVRNWRTFNPSC
jgi:DnaJ-class molecular chaperone